MFDDIFAQIVAHGVGIPAGRVKEALRPLGSHFAHLLGELPAVLTFQASEKAGEVAPRSLPELRSAEPVGDTGVQLPKQVRPPLDGGEVLTSTSGFLRSQMLLLCWLEEQHTVVRWKCRCRIRACFVRFILPLHVRCQSLSVRLMQLRGRQRQVHLRVRHATEGPR